MKIPIKKAVKDNVLAMLKFEYPNILYVINSPFVFRETKNHIDEKKIINGKRLTIWLGTDKPVSKKGKLKPNSEFFKYSISSNKFNIIPKEMKIKRTLKVVFK